MRLDEIWPQPNEQGRKQGKGKAQSAARGAARSAALADERKVRRGHRLRHVRPIEPKPSSSKMIKPVA